MKRIPLLLLPLAAAATAIAQDTDTLKNHASGVTLEAGTYSGGDWGFYAGHNSKEQQQFGEKYLVDDHVHVLGVVAHITTSTGTVNDPNFEVDFRLWEADPATGKPSGSTGIEHGHLHLGDAHIGGANIIMFHEEAHVEETFFVTMDLGDYAHDGLSGDTVGLYHAPHGARSADDIAGVPFRNVFQAHSHGAPNWRDFYTQFTTPTQIATHLALYPIVEMEEHSSIGNISKNGLTISSPYPNPSANLISFPLQLTTQADVSFNIMDISGKIIRTEDKGYLNAGEHIHTFDISTLPSGTYILSVISSEGSVGVKFNKI